MVCYDYDLPEHACFSKSVAIDTEAMGLCYHRDRLCLVQLCDEEGNICLVHFKAPHFDRSPNLKKLLLDDSILKIFHFARFDIGILQHSLGIRVNSAYCTKIASHLVRTFTKKHSLKDLCHDLLGIELAKEEQTSDWGAFELSEEQKKYASHDVLHLHALKEKLDILLMREGRLDMAQACFDFLSYRCELDVLAGDQFDVFAHKCFG